MGHYQHEEQHYTKRPDDVTAVIKKYQRSNPRTSLVQVVSTVCALLACYILLYAGFMHGWWAVLLIAPIASGLSVRTFVLQHDCGHGSLFRHDYTNNLVGRLCSLLTLTPYDHWKRHHALHHGSWNNTDSRGRLSDMYSDCITVREYSAMTKFQKFLYRFKINPILSIFVMPPIIFFISYRVAFDAPRGWARERLGVYLTNACLFFIFGFLIWYAGLKIVSLVSFVVIYPAAVSGVWLFLVQHKFEGVLWKANPQWSAFDASLTGCSFLRLPRLLRWFSGNIGTHHVHHAAPGIPNYHLLPCHNDHPIFQNAKVLNMYDGFRASWTNMLWDEDTRKMVALRSVRSSRNHRLPRVRAYSLK
ncbi:fatty acid desaturase [Acetobacter sp. DsW_063]|uniref:fatty acid desaturase family protein n=1 Tax=Acetobacter sp. DsW_063 TaxID=1514894 RepID=UPI000A3CF865|nr:fatty acid desaturase [Acetobacter sp. DsW_063]